MTQPGGAVLVPVTGMPTTGKSTVAEAAAGMLGCAVLSPDWAMAGLKPYARLQAAFESMRPGSRRAVGWSVLRSLARVQLRESPSELDWAHVERPVRTGCRVYALYTPDQTGPRACPGRHCGKGRPTSARCQRCAELTSSRCHRPAQSLPSVKRAARTSKPARFPRAGATAGPLRGRGSRSGCRRPQPGHR